MALEPLPRQCALIFQAIWIPRVPGMDINVPAISLAGFGRTVPLFVFLAPVGKKQTTAMPAMAPPPSSGSHGDHPLYEKG
ncbi:MAG: hypothetical protein V1882_11885 [Candidatus Omnitrophota bacterium]